MPRTKQFCEEEVLNRAVELFWEKGFHATSMQDLVNYLGINRASLYDTFGGKEALFDKALEQYRKTSLAWLTKVFETEASVREGFGKLFRSAIQEATTDSCRKGCFVVNTTTELVPGNDKMAQVLMDHKRHVEDMFVGLVQKGVDEGEISPSKDPKEIGPMLFALYNGIRVVSKIDTDTDRLQKVVNAGLSVLD